MPKKINLTKTSIEALKPPKSGRQFVYDQKVTGLAIRLTDTGHKAFYLYRKIHGKAEKRKIGDWPEWTVERARDEAERLNGRIAEGQNPNEQRRVNRDAPTLGQVFDEYIEKPTRGKKKKPRSPKTIHDYKQQFKAYLEPWRNRQLSKIKRQDVETLHATLGEQNGTYTANRVLALLKALLNYALDEEYYPLNVARKIKGFEEQSRDRYLSAEELPRFWKAIDAEPTADFFRVSLFTGARQANVLAMKWEQISLGDGLWKIPKTKGGESQVIPLSPAVIEILKRRRAHGGEWVFPRIGGPGPMPAPRHGWTRILKAAGLEGLRMHDLRRSLASWQVSTGASETVIGKSLGHASIQATKIYARADVATVRNAVETAVEAMVKAATKDDEKKEGGA